MEESSRIYRTPVSKEVNENDNKSYKVNNNIGILLRKFETRLKKRILDIKCNRAETTLSKLKRGLSQNAFWLIKTN